MNTNNQEYGVAKNKADSIANIGKKTHLLEKDIEAQVSQMMQERENEEKRRNEQRYFDTNNRENFVKKNMADNTVGRRVMKTQDG